MTKEEVNYFMDKVAEALSYLDDDGPDVFWDTGLQSFFRYSDGCRREISLLNAGDLLARFALETAKKAYPMKEEK